MKHKPGEVGFIDEFSLKSQKATYIRDIKACKTEEELVDVLRRIAAAVQFLDIIISKDKKSGDQ